MGDVVRNFIERVTHGKPGRDLGYGKARGLRRQGGASRDAGVHFNHHHAARLRVDRELNVRAAGLHANLANDRDGGISHHLVLLVGERLSRRHRDAVARVDAHGVEVLDGADDDHVVVDVPHHLQLELLPALDGLLDEHLRDRASSKPCFQHGLVLILSVSHPASRAAKRVAGPDHDGKPQLTDGLPARLDRARDHAFGQIEPALPDRLLELFPVLGLADHLVVCPQHLHLVLLEDAFFPELGGQVEAGLPSEGW